MSRDDLHFRLRIPPDLKNRVEAAAADAKRSMTAEIIARLENSFSGKAWSDDQVEGMKALMNLLMEDLTSKFTLTPKGESKPGATLLTGGDLKKPEGGE